MSISSSSTRQHGNLIVSSFEECLNGRCSSTSCSSNHTYRPFALVKYGEWETGSNRPIRRIHCLVNFEVDGDAAKDHSFVFGKSILSIQMYQHAFDGHLSGAHKGRSNTRCEIPLACIGKTIQWTRCQILHLLDWFVFQYLEANVNLHGTFNCSTTDFSFSLCSVAIANRKERTINKDWEIDFGSFDQMLAVDIATVIVWRHLTMRSRVLWCDPHLSCKRMYGNANTGFGRVIFKHFSIPIFSVELPNLQKWFLP